MFIKPNIIEITVVNGTDSVTYRNRRIDINKVEAYDKSQVSPKRLNDNKDADIKVPTIKFTCGKGHIIEWWFKNEQDRDDILNKIDELLKVLTLEE